MDADELASRLVGAQVLDAELAAACAADPDPRVRAVGHTYRATVHRARVELAAALAESELAVGLMGHLPGNRPIAEWWAFQVYGDVLDEYARFETAAVALHRALELAEGNHMWTAFQRTIGKLVWLARRQGDSAEMVRLLRRLVNNTSTDAHSLNAAVGSALGWLGRPAASVVYLERALACPGTDIQHARDHRVLASALRTLGRTGEAAGHVARSRTLLGSTPAGAREYFHLAQVEFEQSYARGEFATAERHVREMLDLAPGPDNPLHNDARVCLMLSQVGGGDTASAAATLAQIDPTRLGAEARAFMLWGAATIAERRRDWIAAAEALDEVHQIASRRYLATATVLQIEAELAARTTGLRAREAGPITAFNRALTTHDQLLMAAAKDLRGPIATFEIGTDLLAAGEVETDRIVRLLDRGAAEMELLLDQLAELEPTEPPLEAPDVFDPAVRVAMIDSSLARAWQAVAPVATGRQLGLETHSPLTAAAEVAPRGPRDPAFRALTSVLAVLVRAAVPGTWITASLPDPDQGLLVEVTVEGSDDPNPVSALTRATAGGPGWWLQAEELLTAACRRLDAEWLDAGRIRVSVGSPIS